jgi:hypothetical protein
MTCSNRACEAKAPRFNPFDHLCRACRSAYNRRRYLAHREAILARKWRGFPKRGQYKTAA